MLLAASGSSKIPNPIYQFIVFMLLMKIGIKGGLELRHAELSDMLLPALFTALTAVVAVALGSWALSFAPKSNARTALRPRTVWCSERLDPRCRHDSTG